MDRVVHAFVAGCLGQLLRFPAWLNGLSPFGPVPELPTAGFTAIPIVVLTAIAVTAALLAPGAADSRHHDLESV